MDENAREEPVAGSMVRIVFEGRWLLNDSSVEMPDGQGRLYRVLGKRDVLQFAKSVEVTAPPPPSEGR